MRTTLTICLISPCSSPKGCFSAVASLVLLCISLGHDNAELCFVQCTDKQILYSHYINIFGWFLEAKMRLIAYYCELGFFIYPAWDSPLWSVSCSEHEGKTSQVISRSPSHRRVVVLAFTGLEGIGELKFLVQETPARESLERKGCKYDHVLFCQWEKFNYCNYSLHKEVI